MTRLLRAMTEAALALLLSASSAAASSPVVGRWRVVRIAGYGEISCGQAAARRALGRTVSITSDAILLPGDPCTGHALSRDTVQVDDFLRRSWQVSRRDLKLRPFRLGETAEHVDAVCGNPLCSTGTTSCYRQDQARSTSSPARDSCQARVSLSSPKRAR